ncbi:MAG: sigma-54 dependent transcriptional regulator [Thermoguttaceae bacterium]
MYAILGNSSWACEIRRSIERAANVQSTVLIVGPSGTGKELIARAIHQQSRRSAGPSVAIDCTSVPAGLFASQLFGHVKGAFSGASCDTLGSFRAADGGTIFLDEIGELGLDLQAQLLRVIQERAVTPVGHHRSLPVDVRIIAATNRDLNGDVAAGRFRLDLYYRLNVVKLTTTPLSSRPEDIEPLCHGFLERWSIENGLPYRRLSAASLQMLMDYDWPGNVRQLQNVLERATVFSDGKEIAAEDVMAALESDLAPATAGHAAGLDDLPSATSHLCQECGLAGAACCSSRPGPWPTLAECEGRLIRETLEKTSQKQRAAARLLGIDWRLLSRKMQKYGISAPCRTRSV